MRNGSSDAMALHASSSTTQAAARIDEPHSSVTMAVHRPRAH
jgi:hypothetical protein